MRASLRLKAWEPELRPSELVARGPGEGPEASLDMLSPVTQGAGVTIDHNYSVRSCYMSTSLRCKL